MTIMYYVDGGEGLLTILYYVDGGEGLLTILYYVDRRGGFVDNHVLRRREGRVC